MQWESWWKPLKCVLVADAFPAAISRIEIDFNEISECGNTFVYYVNRKRTENYGEKSTIRFYNYSISIRIWCLSA